MSYLTQSEADFLANLEKIILEKSINFPINGKRKDLKIYDKTNSEKLTLHILSSNKFPQKCSYTQVYNKSVVFLRVDTEQKIHINPDGAEISAPHIHIYQEGFEDRYAYPLPDTFKDSKDLVQTLYDLFEYSNIINVKDIKVSIQGGLYNENNI